MSRREWKAIIWHWLGERSPESALQPITHSLDEGENVAEFARLLRQMGQVTGVFKVLPITSESRLRELACGAGNWSQQMNRPFCSNGSFMRPRSRLSQSDRNCPNATSTNESDGIGTLRETGNPSNGWVALEADLWRRFVGVRKEVGSGPAVLTAVYTSETTDSIDAGDRFLTLNVGFGDQRNNVCGTEPLLRRYLPRS